MLFDTHTHLTDERFNEDRETLIASLPSAGISHILEVGHGIANSIEVVALANRHSHVFTAVGVHPYDTPHLTNDDMQTLKNLALQNPDKVLAIGEIGLDYHADNHTYAEAQKHWFEQQLLLAQELSLPVIIHNRDSHADCLAILRKHNVTSGIMHCFSGDAQFAQEVTDMGLHISFAGTLTYKKSQDLVEACKVSPLSKILIETDCPYLPPEPHRGKLNSPLLIHLIAEKIAEIRQMDSADIIRITTENAMKLLNTK